MKYNSKLNQDYMSPLPAELTNVWKTSKALEDKIYYIFSHPRFKFRKQFLSLYNINNNVLLDMGRRAVQIGIHFIENQQQYNHSLENIHWHILTRMWKQVYRHKILNNITIDKYYGCKAQLLNIDNSFLETLLDTVISKNYMIYDSEYVYNEPKDNGIYAVEKMDIEQTILDYEYV